MTKWTRFKDFGAAFFRSFTVCFPYSFRFDFENFVQLLVSLHIVWARSSGSYRLTHSYTFIMVFNRAAEWIKYQIKWMTTVVLPTSKNNNGWKNPKWIELKMKMELRRESGKRLWQWRWRARTNERVFTHSVVCAPARWRPETNKNHEELQIELIHTRMPKWMNRKKMKNTHTQRARNKARRFRNQNTHDGIE